MGHAELENRTPFVVEGSFAADEDGRPLFVPVRKATYALQGNSELAVADKQIPVTFAGELWGEPGKSSYKYEPEGAFTKPATDVVLIGHAFPPSRTTETFVR